MLRKIKQLFQKKEDSNTPLHLPRHVGIIMDGNGRWAKKRFLPINIGHAKGGQAAWEITKEASKLGIEFLTLYTFSIENWNRGEAEANEVISLVFAIAEEKVNDLNQLNIRASVIGDISKLSDERQKTIEKLQKLTEKNTGLKVFIALNYSGRWDIVHAANTIYKKIQNGELPNDKISNETFQSHVCLGELPPPDLIIRTAGDMRISNFMLWQIAYSELYFTNTLWPDFNIAEFKKALLEFNIRERRFGSRK